MSRAFVNEDHASEELPERLISPHPNLVTEEGLRLIEADVQRLSRAYAEAQASGSRNDLNEIARDLRYWTQRRSTAEVVPQPQDTKDVRFGAKVEIERADGKRQSYRIVGEDEASPRDGKISYVSPLARALIGLEVGDEIEVGPLRAVIVRITA